MTRMQSGLEPGNSKPGRARRPGVRCTSTDGDHAALQTHPKQPRKRSPGSPGGGSAPKNGPGRGNEVIVRLPKWLMPPGALAFTAYPVIFVSREVVSPTRLGNLLLHERVHLGQQRRWALFGLGVGLLAWWVLYLAALPMWWNPLRRSAETEAYRAQGFTDSQINTWLTQAPYWLAPRGDK